MNDNDRALCATTAGLIRASGAIAVWGLALALIAGLVLALTGRSLPPTSWAAFAVVALAGLPERYAAFRLRHEAAIYEALCQGAIPTLAALEASFKSLGLRRETESSRPLAEHVRATRQLMQRHGFTVVMQTIVFALGLALE